MNSPENEFHPKLPARITGIVFWGLVLVGLLLAVFLLRQAEKDLYRINNSNAHLIAYELEEVLESGHSDTDDLTRRIKAKMEELKSETGFNLVKMFNDNDQLAIGDTATDDDMYQRRIEYFDRGSEALTSYSLEVYFPNQQQEVASIRKTMLLSIGVGVVIFGLILQRILQLVLSNPFSRMVNTAQQFSRGNELIRFDQSRNDEFGYLGKFINNAIESILKHRRDLEAAFNKVTESELELHREKEFAEVTLKSITESVITVSVQETIQSMNPAAEILLGVSQNESVGQSFATVVNLVSDHSSKSISNPVAECFSTGDVIRMPEHISLINSESSIVAIEATVAPMKNDKGDMVGGVIVIKDVSHTRRLTTQLSYQASHDMLTGLYNRRKFEEHLQEVLLNVPEEAREHSLCYLDLDQFKVVNDTCGHAAGDELLQQLPAVFNKVLRSDDIIARLGGDEFGVLLENCDISQAVIIANKIRQQIKEYRFVWEGKTFEIGVSIGIVAIHENNCDMAEIMSAADVACYTAKDTGRNRVHVYEASDVLVNERRGQMHWTSKITQALEDDRFRLYKQPIVNLHGDRTDHFEVLLRMVDDQGNIIPPGAFIPAAERYKLMFGLDKWVIRKVFSLLVENYPDHAELGDPIISINLSGDSVSDDSLLDYILEQKTKYEISLTHICFEITETAAISNIARAAKLITELKNYGCHFALDDFGSGLSSFTYLKALPVNYVKIDGSFVKDIVHDQIDFAMVQAINQIGKVMGLQTVAERVENAATLQLLKDMDVDYAQGYHTGRPEPLD